MSASELCDYLLYLPFKWDQTVVSDLNKANSIDDIFFTLKACGICSFWDYNIFECIISEYDLDHNQEKLQYKNHFKLFVEKHKVSEFIAMNPVLAKYNDASDVKEVIFKLNMETFSCPLSRVRDITFSIAEILDLTPSSLRLLDIKDGCMEVTFLVPGYEADQLFSNNWKHIFEQSERLLAVSVSSVICSNSIFHTKNKKLSEIEDRKAQPLPPCRESFFQINL